LAAATLALALGTAAPGLWAEEEKAKAPIPFDEARLIIEFNATDEDIGVQLFLDGEAWKSLKLFAPRGRKILDVFTKGSLGALGLTEFFLESEEPTLDELSLEEFFALFPEGNYTFIGETVEGEKIAGTARFTHTVPDAPELIAPAEGAVVNPANTVIRWEAVDDPPGSEIVAYEVIVEREDPFRMFSVHVPATATSVTVPAEFLEPDTEYDFEVLAIEAGGNQTISESSFVTQ
jgi:hypothetical protein